MFALHFGFALHDCNLGFFLLILPPLGPLFFRHGRHLLLGLHNIICSDGTEVSKYIKICRAIKLISESNIILCQQNFDLLFFLCTYSRPGNISFKL